MDGGGIAYHNDNSSESFTLTNCTFFNNSAGSYGGGLGMQEGTCTLSHCTFSNNISTGNSGGGVAVFYANGTLIFNNCLLVNNTGNDYYYGAGTLTDNGYNVVEYQSGASTGAGKTFNSSTDILYNTKADGTTGYSSWNKSNVDLNNQTLNLSSNLSYNGGYTETLPVTGSGFLNESEGAGSSGQAQDQRGYYRKSGTIYYGTTPTSTTNYISRGAYQYYGITARTNTVNNWTSASNNYYTDLQGAEDHVSAGTTVKLAGTSILLSEVDISQSITLTGEGTESTTLRVAEPGITNSRVFNINASGSTINISNMTIQGGHIPDAGGGEGGAITMDHSNTTTTVNMDYVRVSNSETGNNGGAFINTGTMNLTNCIISGNKADDYGGGFRNYRDMTITNSTISGNSALLSGSAFGGGIFNSNGATISLTNSTVSGNSSNRYGGGICNYGTISLTNSTVNGNSADQWGGGIENRGTMTITNSTISGNSADDYSGGIKNDGTMTITYSTISGNSTDGIGGGLYNYEGHLTIKNTILADNTASTLAGDFFHETGTVVDNGYNIVEDDEGYTFEGTGDITGQQSNLFGTGLTSQSLADNGGPTQTLAIEAGSVAIGAGTWDATITTDQRGYIRSNPPTIGAYEYSGSNTITWDGSLNTNWNTTDNWDCETVPTSSYNVIIPGSLSNYPVIASGMGASTNDLSVNNGASLNLNSGGSLITNGSITNEGTISIEKTLADDGHWHFVSAPTNNATAAIFSGMYLQEWDEAAKEWIDITEPEENLSPVQGYSLWSPAGAKGNFTFTGTPNTGNQSISLAYHDNSEENDGANLVGNPFPSYLDWDEVNGYGTKYTWNGADYDERTEAGAGDGSRYVAPLESFFVVTGSSGNTFSLTNDVRTHTSAKKEASALSNGIVLSASSQNYCDALYIVFDEAANENFELPHDAWKFVSGTTGICQIWSQCPDGNLAVDVRPETESIQLGFTNNESGTYSIGIKEIADISTAILEDTKLNIFHDLSEGAYSFDWRLNDDETRFKLHFNTTAVSEINGSVVHAYVAGGNIIIQSDQQPERIILTDITGRTLGVWENRQNIPAPSTTGVYLVTIELENHKLTGKIIVE